MYREAYPRSQKDSYSPNENITFLVKIPDGYEMQRGSIKLHGNLRYRRNGAVIDTAADEIYFDAMSGVHNFFDNWTSSTSGVGIVEHLNEYSRFVKMLQMNNSNDLGRGVSTAQNVELKAVGDLVTNTLLAGVGGTMPFSMKPVIALNRSNRSIRSSDMASFQVQFKLQDPLLACYGLDNIAGNNVSYTMTGLKMSYTIAPQGSDKATGPLMFKTVSVLKHTVDSRLANIEVVLPIDSKNMVTSCATLANLQTNSMSTDYIDIDNVKYLLNDSNGKLISFDLKTDLEIVHFYSQAMKGLLSEPIDSLLPATYKTRFGFGMTFDSQLKASTKVSIELQSDADAGAGLTYQLFTYMTGMIEV